MPFSAKPGGLPGLLSFSTLCLFLLPTPGAGQATAGNSAVHFRVTAEPRENAFTILVPRGWITEGGIVRVDPNAAGGPANSIAAKVDFAVKSDSAGTVMLRSLPDMLYMDMRRSPAGAMFPAGSNYSGMTVYPLMDALTFLARVAVPRAHPQARNLQVLERRPLPDLVRKIQALAQSLPPANQFRYDAAVLTVSYQERGVGFKETLFTIVEDMGALGAGMWSNKETCFYRAPAAEFEKWAPVASVIKASGRINPQWLRSEIRGQIQRGEIVLRTQREIQEIDRQIVAHREQTNAEIHNDMFLTLTGQEEYLNPYTNQVERGSNQWKYRWVTPSGDVAYSDDPYYDPNHDPRSHRSDFRRSPVRPRKP